MGSKGIRGRSDGLKEKDPLLVLAESMFFQGLDRSVLLVMLNSMTNQTWPVGTFKHGSELGCTLHFLLSGRIKVFQINSHSGREHTIFLLKKGDVFDILTLMDSQRHNVYWEAIDDVEVLSMAMVDVRNWISKYPIMHNSLLNYMGYRMRELEDIATDISLNNTLIRLCHLLLKNINGHSLQLELINNLSHEEIASLIGTTRAVVNRHIQELKKCGAIKVGQKHINIQSIEKILAISEKKFLPEHYN